MNWTTRIALCTACVMALVPFGGAQQFGVGTPQPALTFQQGIITTLAGNGTSGSSGDAGLASSAELTNGLRGIAADAAGDVFFADDTNHTVRVVYQGGATAAALITAENPTVTSPQAGYIYVVAGKEGSSGTPANGTLATSELITPGAGLSLNAAGDVYFNDAGTNKVWIIYAGGTGTAGTNFISLEAGVSSPKLGYLYAVAGGSTTGGYTGDGSLATSSTVELHGVNDMKFDDAGDMYIVDQGNNCIRVVSGTTGIITTFAGGGGESGTGNAGTSGATGVNGPATAALLNGPYGVAVDAAGDVYIADKNNHEIKVVYMGGAQAEALIALENTTISTPTVGDIYIVAGNGSSHYPYGTLATKSALSAPTMVALDAAGNIYIADNGYDVIQEVDAVTGIMISVAGNSGAGYSGDGGSATGAQMSGIRCVAVDAAGRLYITDATNLRVREVSQGILVFVGEPVGSTSAPQTVTLVNTGNAPLDFTGGTPQFGGTNSSDFAIDSSSTLNTCSLQSLQPAASCEVAITYAPTNSGTSAAILTYTTNGALATQQITLQGELTPANVGLAASTTSTYPGQSVTLTATVSSPLGTPTGTVVFMQGTTVLETATLPASGIVTYTVSSLALGAETYTAVYSGDTNFAGYTSNVVAVNVDSFTISASPTTLSVAPGQASQTTLTITGQGPSTQIVSLSCFTQTVLGCAFTPSLASVPSGGTATVTLSIGAVATTSSIKASSGRYALALLPFGAILAFGFGARRRSKLTLLSVVFCFLALGMISGCAENNIGKALGPSTQSVIVTVSGQGSNPLMQYLTLTVDVQ